MRKVTVIKSEPPKFSIKFEDTGEVWDDLESVKGDLTPPLGFTWDSNFGAEVD